MNKARRNIQALAFAFAASFGAAQAQTPGAPVRILVGFPPGGVVDVVARAFAEQLQRLDGRSVIVENRTGASGKIAIDALLSAPAQGDIVEVVPASVLALSPLVMKSTTYDSVRDFAALGSLAEYGFAVAAGPAAKVDTLQAYKAWALAHPKESAFASPGLGTPQHFLGAQLQKALGVPIEHIPYKGGASSVTDVLGGQVPLLITTAQLLPPYEAQGKLKTLFITSSARNPKMPNVPTAAEVGLPELATTDWFGLFAKAGTPPAKVAEWRALVAKVLADPKYAATIRAMGYDVPAAQPTDFPKLMSEDRAAWAARVRVSGFKITD